MAQKSYALLVSILVTFILLDCFTECGAAKNKGKGKGKARQKGKWRNNLSGLAFTFSKCTFDADINFVCGSDAVVYWNSKNLECAKEFKPDLKEAEQSTCPSWPNTDDDKKKLQDTYTEIVVKTAAETRRKNKNDRQKVKKPNKPTNQKNPKPKDEKRKRKG